MARILVTYATMAGSTAEVAGAIAEELSGSGLHVDVEPVQTAEDVGSYDGVVVGGPVIFGWHRRASRFVRRHRREFARTPLAIFLTAMSLTETEGPIPWHIPVFVDEALPRPPAVPGRLSLRERYTQTSNYLRPILRGLRPAKPVSVGVFGGRLEYGRLPWWAVVFAMAILRAPAADRRNWDAIRTWAASLARAMQPGPEDLGL